MALVLQGYRTLKMPGVGRAFKAGTVIQTELTANDQPPDGNALQIDCM
jgi:hypothetical protein